MPVRSRLGYFSFYSLLLLTAAYSGCSGEDDIRQYSVPKTVAAARLPTAPVSAGSLTGAASGWFFKLMGPSDDVLKQAIPFTRILQSLQFSPDGAPGYQLPEGWKSSNGPPPRYQTLTIPETQPPLEVTVSSLPMTGSDVPGYLLANINRWRGQLGLDAMEGDQWMEEARARGELILAPAKDRLIAMVNLNGETKETGPTRMLAAIVVERPAAAETLAPEKSSPISYTAPEGWSESAGNVNRLASLEAKPESGTVDISVSRILGGGDVLANVNRWRQQVPLEPWTEETLTKEIQKLEIGGRPADYVEAIGKEQSILAAILPDGDAKWFFKAQGPTAAIEAERAHFREFLLSVKFNRGNE
ncbi:hypothetical protein [Planctomicrobium piriforme]|uniref:Uncharacterized protein n=1 Tax=Planctomicrobium piriforme TaxID=1576369 RepID=A0A1I3F8R2_9PLAN|nr:hypothetical protein [Planctomicrobium piriforme]SFI07563.1 hypothetical protein SAMN05421753_105129 [Planctomicrobium piriforme]